MESLGNMNGSVQITVDFPACLIFLRAGSRLLPTTDRPWKAFRPTGELDQNVRTWFRKLSKASTLKVTVFREIAAALQTMGLVLEPRPPQGFAMSWKVNQRTVPLPPDHFYRRLIDLDSNLPLVVARDVVEAVWADEQFEQGYRTFGHKVLTAIGADPTLPRNMELSYFDFALYLSAGQCSVDTLQCLRSLSDTQLQTLRDLQAFFSGFLSVLEQPITNVTASPFQSMDEISGVWQIETVELFFQSDSAQRFCDSLFDVARTLSPEEIQRSAEHPADILMPSVVFEFNEKLENRPEAIRYWRGEMTLRMNGDELVATTKDFQNAHFMISGGRVTREGFVTGTYRFVEIDSCGVFHLWKISPERMEGSYIGHEPTDMAVKPRRFPIVGGKMYCTKLNELPSFT